MARRQLFFFPPQPEKIKDAKDDLNKGGTRRRQTDLEQGDRNPLTCQIGNWNPHEESTDQSLEHDESRLAAAVEIADARITCGSLANSPESKSPWKKAK